MSEEKPKKKRKPKSAAEMMTTGSLGSPDLQRFSRVPRARPYGTREKVNHLSDPGDPDRKNLCNMIENVQRRSYGKSELAMLYFPDSDPHVALNRLNAWIRRCPPLVEALAGCSQGTHAKYFCPKAVRLITEYLGDP